jgi:hypothetical protein
MQQITRGYYSENTTDPISIPRYGWRSPSTSANLTMPEAEMPGVPQGAVGVTSAMDVWSVSGKQWSLGISSFFYPLVI